MGVTQPFMYDKPSSYNFGSPTSRPFNPKVVTQASWTPAAPKIKQDGPLINFNIPHLSLETLLQTQLRRPGRPDPFHSFLDFKNLFAYTRNSPLFRTISNLLIGHICIHNADLRLSNEEVLSSNQMGEAPST